MKLSKTQIQKLHLHLCVQPLVISHFTQTAIGKILSTISIGYKIIIILLTTKTIINKNHQHHHNNKKCNLFFFFSSGELSGNCVINRRHGKTTQDSSQQSHAKHLASELKGRKKILQEKLKATHFFVNNHFIYIYILYIHIYIYICTHTLYIYIS